VKILCHCGDSISDQTDDLPNKGHLVPDQNWFATFDAIDDEVIDPLAGGLLSREEAYQRTRQIIIRSSRLMWQCRACGRLYIDGVDGQLRCYAPDGERRDHEILRSR
jgi:hypothetical protein